MEAFDLAAYLTTGVESLVKNILRATLKDPKESAFMVTYSRSVKDAAKRRAELNEGGEHIGGCVLFEQKDKVEAIVERNKQNG